jgi:hypothetical protein
MPLHLHDPSSGRRDLRAEILDVLPGATGGGALLAFANVPGIRTAFGTPTFDAFLGHHNFTLYVGLDAITDERALRELADLHRKMPRFRVYAFWHDERRLFHPKLFWFTGLTTDTLIVGSGNLTTGGLSTNWEAFLTQQVGGVDRIQARAEIAAWIRSNRHRLIPPEDPRAIARAQSNRPNERILIHPKPRPAPPPPPALAAVDILLAEVTRSGDRLSQVNFDQATFQTFFGAMIGGHTPVAFRELRPDGTLEGAEARQGVDVASHNYRFEIGALRGRTYPDQGRPIGVYLSTGPADFMYMMLFPDDEHYEIVDRILEARHPATAAGRLRRGPVSQTELRADWPESPLWDVLR